MIKHLSFKIFLIRAVIVKNLKVFLIRWILMICLLLKANFQMTSLYLQSVIIKMNSNIRYLRISDYKMLIFLILHFDEK